MIPLSTLLKMVLDIVLGHRTVTWMEGILAGFAAIVAVTLYYFLKFDITKYLPIFNSLLSADPKTILDKPASCKCPTLGEQGLSVFGGNVGLASIVTAVASLAVIIKYWNELKATIKSSRRFTVSLEIRQSNELFSELLDLIQTLQCNKDKPQHVTLWDESLDVASAHGRQENSEYVPGFKSKNKITYVPAAGTSHFSFGGKSFELERCANDNLKKNQYGEIDHLHEEVIVISTWGRDTSIFNGLIAEAKQLKQRNTVHATTIYYANPLHMMWLSRSRGRTKRSLDSVILQEGILERLVNDMQRFMDSPAWYKRFGVPYHRGYLLHGPPGTGKSSLISAIAANFNMSIGLLNLTDPSLCDSVFRRLMESVPKDMVIVLEDIDAAFGKTKSTVVTSASGAESDEEGTAKFATRGKKAANLLTFSGLLNALDGLDATEPRILFMTTNHLENLDAALIRPGRVDVKEYIGYASEKQMIRMFKRFKEGNGVYSNRDSEEFVKMVTDSVGTDPDKEKNPKPVTLAQVQEILIQLHLNHRCVSPEDS